MAASRRRRGNQRWGLALVGLLTACLCGGGAAPTERPPAPSVTPYAFGDELSFECRNVSSGEWGPPPICVERDAPLSFVYGVDGFFSCSLLVDAQLYAIVRRLVALEAHWMCRVGMSSASGRQSAFLPVPFTLWGVLDKEHVHVSNRMNAAFHGDAGRVSAAALYPVRDKFQYLREGSILNLHGAVHWMKHGAFASLDSSADGGGTTTRLWPLALAWSLCTAAMTAAAGVYFYRVHVRPELVKSFIKSD